MNHDERICEEVRERIAAGADLYDATAHLEACPACAALARARAVPTGGGLEALMARVEADQRAESGARARLRSWPTRRRRWAIAGVAGLVALMVALFNGRADLSLYPINRLLAELGVFASLFLLLLLSGVDRRLVAGQRPAHLVALVLALLLPWSLALLPQAHAAHPASLLGVGDDFVKRAVGCLIYGSLTALPTWIALRLFERSDQPDPRRDLLHGALAGTAGLVAVHLHCPLTAALHLTAGHAPLVLFTALLTTLALGLRRAR